MANRAGLGQPGSTRSLRVESLEKRRMLATVINYPWPDTIPESDLYEVRAYHNGQATELFTHFSDPNLDPGQDGNGINGLIADRTMSFVQFAFDGRIEIEVEKLYGSAATRVEVSPNAYGIDPHYFDGRTVRFFVENLDDRTEYLSVNFVSADNLDSDGSGGQDIKHGLMLFGDAPQNEAPNIQGPGVVVYSDTVSDAELAAADTIYFPPGDYDLTDRYPTNPYKASLNIARSGQEVYVAGGAYIRGALHANRHNELRIYGRGIFSGRDLVWHDIRDPDGDKEAFFNLLGSTDSTIEGIVITNSTHHTLPSSNRTTIENIKIIGWAFNNDGIRPSDGSRVSGVFIKTMDDYDYARDEHTFEDSVIWPMRNGAFGQLGWNNLGDGETTYRDIYFIHPEWNAYNENRGIIGSQLNQGVNQSGNTLENLYAQDHLSLLANITIQHDPGRPFNANNPGLIEDFTFRNILIDDFTAANGSIIRNPIAGFDRNGAKAMVRDIRFINVVAGDTLITQANHATYFDIDPNTTSNITFETEGVIHRVQASASQPSRGRVFPSGDLPVPAGMTRSVTIVPNAGYRIQSVFVDGVDVGRVQNVTFDDVSGDHTVLATFTVGTDYFDCTPTLPGDYNLDGVVNAIDYTVYRDQLGQTVPMFGSADGNGNSSIDDGDWDVWASNYGRQAALPVVAASAQATQESIDAGEQSAWSLPWTVQATTAQAERSVFARSEPAVAVDPTRDRAMLLISPIGLEDAALLEATASEDSQEAEATATDTAWHQLADRALLLL